MLPVEAQAAATAVNWDLVQFVVGVPALLAALSYFLPGARLRRKIKADAEVAAALPPSELRDWYEARVARNAQKLLRYRVYIVESGLYPLQWLGAVATTIGVVSLFLGPPASLADLWHREPIGLILGLFAVAGTVSLLLGGSATLQTADMVRAEWIELQEADQKAALARAARGGRSFVGYHGPRLWARSWSAIRRSVKWLARRLQRIGSWFTRRPPLR